MTAKTFLFLVLLAAAAIYVGYVHEKRLRCLAHGGDVTYRTLEPIGPLNDRKTGVPKSNRNVMMCVDAHGRTLF